jgi:hypothetical protein
MSVKAHTRKAGRRAPTLMLFTQKPFWSSTFAEGPRARERSKTRIRAQAVEGRFDLEQGDLPVPRSNAFGSHSNARSVCTRPMCTMASPAGPLWDDRGALHLSPRSSRTRSVCPVLYGRACRSLVVSTKERSGAVPAPIVGHDCPGWPGGGQPVSAGTLARCRRMVIRRFAPPLRIGNEQSPRFFVPGGRHLRYRRRVH